MRSFVRRAGRLTPGQERARQRLWPQFGLDCTGGELEFESIFGRSAPCALEIGFGNGESLVEQAAARPEWDFLGIEVHEPGIGHCLLALERTGLSNLRLIAADAVTVLRDCVPRDSIARMNLYFPDPWPKKRHHKRRIVQPAFLDLVARALEPGGAFHLATDWANYDEHIEAALGKDPRFELQAMREHGGDAPIDRPQTKFERRGLRLGHRIYDRVYRLRR